MASLMRITSRLADQCSGADISGDAMKLEKDLAEGSKKEIPLRPPCESKHHPSMCKYLVAECRIPQSRLAS
jgi:hypothetical protein